VSAIPLDNSLPIVLPKAVKSPLANVSYKDFDISDNLFFISDKEPPFSNHN